MLKILTTAVLAPVLNIWVIEKGKFGYGNVCYFSQDTSMFLATTATGAKYISTSDNGCSGQIFTYLFTKPKPALRNVLRHKLHTTIKSDYHDHKEVDAPSN